MNSMYNSAFLDSGVGIWIAIFFYLIVVGGGFTLLAFYYKTMIEVMSLVRQKNRKTEIGNVLFTIIPLFNLVYGFIVYPKICESIGEEFKQLGLPEDKDFGKNLVIAMQALMVSTMIPILNFIVAIPLLILFILFWVKMDGYKKRLDMYNKNGFGEDTSSSITSSSSDTLD